SGYALAFGLLLVPSGRLGDATGRKRLFLAGVAVFVAGAVIAGLSQSIEMLNAARLVQGVGSGMLNPQTFGLIQKYFRGAARARAFATLATTVSIATASGPLVGGVLIEVLGDDLGWRAMFLVNVPLGVLAMVLGQRWLPDDRRLPPGEAGPDVGGSAARAGDMARLAAERDGGQYDGGEYDDAEASRASRITAAVNAALPKPHPRPRRARLDLDPVGIVLLGVAVLSLMLPFLTRGGNPAYWALVPVGLGVLAAF